MNNIILDIQLSYGYIPQKETIGKKTAGVATCPVHPAGPAEEERTSDVFFHWRHTAENHHPGRPSEDVSLLRTVPGRTKKD